MKIYKVGGAVRDSIMGVQSSDNDWVVVGSSPEEMISKGYKPIGKDFPVFLHPKTNEEYALARTEKKTGIGYGGFTFYYDTDVTIEDDLYRRDFTINAIAEDQDGNIIDPFNGRDDIKNKIFKNVSDAFFEDPLRAIRLARFFSYDHLQRFKISDSTNKNIEKIVSSNEIANLSPDRIWSETESALSNPHPNTYFQKIIDLNLCEPFFKKLKVAKCNSLNNKVLRWAELQINNDFELGENLPIPNHFKNIANLSKNLLEVKKQNEDQILITVIDKIDFVKNEKEICELVEISVFKEHKQYILDLSDTIQKTDFSVLANVSNEKIREEKSKMYKTIINKCK